MADKSISPPRREAPISHADPAPAREGAEANAIMRRVWDEPCGEAYAFRQAISGSNRDEDHSELTAAETPETTRHLSDASLSAKDLEALRGPSKEKPHGTDK